MADLIDRQAAIDAAHKSYDRILDFHSDGETVAQSFEDILTALPSAQPEYYDYSDIEHTWNYYAEENDINLTANAKQIKDAMWVGYRKGKESAQSEPSQVAKDIATILGNQQDMRVLLEQKTGRWVKTEKHHKDDQQEFYYYEIRCSECGEKPEKSYHLTPYCPWCGAKLEEVEE